MVRRRAFGLLALILMLTLFCGMIVPAQAAGITSKTPKINAAKSTYLDGRVVLKWGKVSGATGYEVYRAASKAGKYVKFATVKTNTLKKAATGAYYYKVRAVKGKQKSKFSAPVLVFAATAVIKEVGFSSVGYVGTYGMLASVNVSNKSKKDMQFLGGYAQKATVYLIDRKTNKPVNSTYMMLNTNNDPYGISISDGITVKAGKSQTLWYHVMEYTLWTQYNSDRDSYYFILSMPFYPGKGTDELITMSITASQIKAQSSVPSVAK
ncbi:MAG: hypothetical protein IKQ80_02775 [Clostridia bacterium]|nr:hypothetical protein [Clostridia bacterium]MBR6890224.1 hypothetical protein [Clostridia bacterium]